MRNVVVVGVGAMGYGIAQLAAHPAKSEVTMVDIDEEILEKATEKIKWSLEKFVDKKKVSQEEMESAISRIKTTIDLEDAAREADFVIEAIPEDMNLKKRTFKEIDGAAPSDAIFASNTSSLSITEMAEATERPDKFVGMHFFNPPQMMELVEIIKGDETSEETVSSTVELAEEMGKTSVICEKDVRGFIVNRILAPLFIDAGWAVYDGEGEVQEVDAAAKLDWGLPMGIFELMDYTGLDINVEAGKVMAEAYGDRMQASPIIEELVEDGKLGMKSGEGFYDSWPGRPRIPFKLAGEFDVMRLYAVTVNEAAWLIEDKAAGPEEIDKAIELGLGWPTGPCRLGDRKGIDSIVSKLNDLYEERKREMYRPCPLLDRYLEEGRGFYE